MLYHFIANASGPTSLVIREFRNGRKSFLKSNRLSKWGIPIRVDME